MPALPWTPGNYHADGRVHVLVSYLPMTRYRDIGRFLRWTSKIRRQLALDAGCAGYTLDAHLLSKTFYTLSAWSDRDAMMSFVHTDEHAAMLADMAGRLGTPQFVEYDTDAGDLPLRWPQARRRLQEDSSRHD